MLRWLPLALLLTACADDRAPRDPDAAPTSDSKAPAGAPLTLIAARNGHFQVVRLSPGAADVEPIGPPLPDVSPATHEIERTWVSGDRLLVALRDREDGRPSVLLAGDGTAWHPLGDLSGDVSSIAPSPDLGRVWIERSEDEQTRKEARLYDFDGRVRAGDGVFRPLPEAPRLAAYGPTWALTLEDGRDLVRYDGEGRHVIRGDASEEAWQRNQLVYAAFPTSLVLRDPWPRLSWIDLDGRPIVVAGFAADPGPVDAPYQVRNGRLEQLADRRVMPLLDLPPSLRVDGIAAVGDDWVLVRSAQDLVAIGAAGELGRYRPAPTTRKGKQLDSDSDTVVRTWYADRVRIGPGPPQLVADVTHLLETEGKGPTEEFLGTSYDLWRLDPRGPRTVRFRDFGPDGYVVLDPRFEANGSAVVWVEGGRLHRIAIDTFAESTLDSDFSFPSPFFASTPDWRGR